MRTSFGCEGKGRYGSFLDKCVGVQAKVWNPWTTRAVPERFYGEVPSLKGAISSVWLLPFYTFIKQGPWFPYGELGECGLYAAVAELLSTAVDGAWKDCQVSVCLSVSVKRRPSVVSCGNCTYWKELHSRSRIAAFVSCLWNNGVIDGTVRKRNCADTTAPFIKNNVHIFRPTLL